MLLQPFYFSTRYLTITRFICVPSRRPNTPDQGFFKGIKSQSLTSIFRAIAILVQMAVFIAAILRFTLSPI